MPGPFQVSRALVGALQTSDDRALTIGNFDGVHLGHRRLLDRVIALGRELRCRPAVLTFDPHPTRFLSPSNAPRLITSLNERIRLLRAAGIEEVIVLPFDDELARLSAGEFVERVLLQGLRTKAVVVGDNFRFGNRAAGDTRMLAEVGRERGFRVEVVPAVQWRGLTVSSSQVRSLLQAGDVGRACRMLRRPFRLEGEVVSGRGVGSRETVPTLNLKTEADLLPQHGVYVTATVDLDGGRRWPSITNVGVRPTFDGEGVSVETFLLEALNGDAPERIAVEFCRWIRPERRFDSSAELKTQILRDVGRAQAWWRRRSRLASA